MLWPALDETSALLATHPAGGEGSVLGPPFVLVFLLFAFLFLGPVIGVATVGLIVAIVESVIRLRPEREVEGGLGSPVGVSARGPRARGRHAHRSPPGRRGSRRP